MKFKISVPATSANVGPGFDVMGIALDLYNRFTFEIIQDEGLEITGDFPEFCNKNNLIYTTLCDILQKNKKKIPGLKIHIDADLPVCSGLGSSSTCIVAGIIAANQIGNLNLSQEEILRYATQIEGHPDNVAPAILGGFVAAIVEDDLVYHHTYPISDKVTFYALIPEFRVPTDAARAILPESYALSDCVYNMSRIPLLVEGLETGDEQLIKAGCKDRVHQQFRGKLIPDFQKIFDFVKNCDEATTIYISGAGPTLMAIVLNDDQSFPKLAEKFCNNLEVKWKIRKMNVVRTGAQIKTIANL